MKIKLRVLVHPSVPKGFESLMTNFTLEGDITKEQAENFKMTELLFKIESALNEHVGHCRFHISVE